MKQDGSIRICGDYKLTVNSASDIESYPLPRIDDLLSSLVRARVFTKLDLAHAYLQLALDEESKKLVTVTRAFFDIIDFHLGLHLPQPFSNVS